MKKGVVDNKPDNYYEYIEVDKELWYENSGAKLKTGEIVVSEFPYLKGVVASKDISKRIVTMKNKATCEFRKTIAVINDNDINVHDMAATKDINEVDLLLNLKNRLLNDKNNPQTFTNVGSTLLVVNPFKRLEGIYGFDRIDHFMDSHDKNNPETRDEVTEPHVYDVVLIAIRELLKPNSQNQALVISGESGAGKTEAAKNAMECITHYFSKKFSQGAGTDSEPLEQQILKCNPILEAFGNAKTVRNDNSSRFGKYVKIRMNAITNIIEGAMIKTYLLEKSRVSELGLLERNYHVFYMLLSGTDEAELNKYHLTKNVQKFKYLYKGPTQITVVEKIPDVELQAELIDCFKSTGFSEDEIKTIKTVLAAVLLFGNLEIKKKGDTDIDVATADVFDHIVELLQVDKENLLNNLTRSPPTQFVKNWGNPYENKKIQSFIDAIAKDLYNKLFLWIVAKLNKKLNKKTGAKQKYFGLLDIFGFECFQINSIEQLCINYTNEQLQQLYIKDIFEADKQEFKDQGLEDKLYLLDASFKDNKDIIKCIDAFFYLTKSDKNDDQIYTTASNFAKEIDKEKRLDQFKGIVDNAIFTEKINKVNFKLVHTAKDVTYCCTNWAEKNIDEIKDSMLDCLFASKNETIPMIFTTTTNKEDHDAEYKIILAERVKVSKEKELQKYLGCKFQIDMFKLRGSLEKCAHHYIRCIKPNEEKKALLFWDNFVFNQIQYLGILATIQVRKSGFPVRRKYKDFYESFKLVLEEPKTITCDQDYQDITKKVVNDLMGKTEKIDEKCLYGKQKIYMKDTFSSALEKAKEVLLVKKTNALVIIKIGYIRMRKLHKMTTQVQAIKEFQAFYNVNIKKIMLLKKKEKIKLIQASYQTNKEVVYFNDYMEKINFIQNSLQIILAKKKIEATKRSMKYLGIRMQIFLGQIKEIHRKKMKIVANGIMNEIQQRIVHKQYIDLWDRVNPYMICLLTKLKYKSIAKEAKRQAQGFFKSNILEHFQYRNFLYKIKKKRQDAKTIFNLASTSMIAIYYSNLIKKVAIIQRHLRQQLDKKQIFDGLVNNYFKDEHMEYDDEYDATVNLLFPYKTINYDNHDNQLTTNGNSINNTEANNKQQNSMTINTIYKTLYTEANQQTISCNNNDMYTLSRNGEKLRKYGPALPKQTISYKDHYFKKASIPKPYKPDIENTLGLIPDISNQTIDDIKIGLFSKIVEIDHITSERNNYDKLWAEEFDKVYRVNMINNTPIQLIYAGNCHSIVINSRGRIFSWGWNDKGQCGIDLSTTVKDIMFPDLRRGQDGKFITLPVMNYTNVGVPISINNLGSVNKVVVGDDYTMALNSEHNVVLFGDNSKGQLGQGNKLPLNGAQWLYGNEIRKKAIDIQSTEDMNAVLLDNNELYVWFLYGGDNYNCRPMQMFINKKITIAQLACGKSFMIILSKSGILYGCGSNTYGELGKPNDNDRHVTPEEIVSVSKYEDRILQVRCGFKHVVCASVNGKAFTWGNNGFGQLGNGSKSSTNVVLIEIKSNKPSEEKERIIQIAAGFRSSIFFTDTREIFYTGIISPKNTAFTPTKFNYKDKLCELSENNDFTPARILSSWNRNFSLFYITFADIRKMHKAYKTTHKIHAIINQVAVKWLSDTIACPFIPQISKYFNGSQMKMNH